MSILLSTRIANASNFFSGFTSNLLHRSCQLHRVVALHAHVRQFVDGLSVLVRHNYQRLRDEPNSQNVVWSQ
jgi:hypothetical protein